MYTTEMQLVSPVSPMANTVQSYSNVAHCHTPLNITNMDCVARMPAQRGSGIINALTTKPRGIARIAQMFTENFHTIHINNAHLQCTMDDVRAYFKPIPIRLVFFPLASSTRDSKHALVAFNSDADAEQALIMCTHVLMYIHKAAHSVFINAHHMSMAKFCRYMIKLGCPSYEFYNHKPNKKVYTTKAPPPSPIINTEVTSWKSQPIQYPASIAHIGPPPGFSLSAPVVVPDERDTEYAPPLVHTRPQFVAPLWLQDKEEKTSTVDVCKDVWGWKTPVPTTTRYASPASDVCLCGHHSCLYCHMRSRSMSQYIDSLIHLGIDDWGIMIGMTEQDLRTLGFAPKDSSMLRDMCHTYQRNWHCVPVC